MYCSQRGLTEKAVVEYGPTGGEGVNYVAIWWDSFPGRRNGNCKDPEAGVYLVGSGNSKDTVVSVGRVRRQREKRTKR